MRSITGRALSLVACMAAVAPVAADSSLRCGSKLIVTGMTQAEVLTHCGPPLTKSEEKVPIRSGTQVVGETSTYRWTYESSGATRVLVFDLDVLKSIE
jgi:Protein of unknown function (DUF2845)